jgi:isopentenyl-diphosphate Delta-isomerase
LDLALVDKDNQVTGKIERWKAHQEGILHRGFTAILKFGNNFLVQNRRHPAFDKNWDLSFSSHQIYKNNVLQSGEDAVIEALNREWGIIPSMFIDKPNRIGSVYYYAKDPLSIYTEHEVDEIYEVKVNQVPESNPEYAYKIEVISQTIFLDNKIMEKYNFCPWVKSIINQIDLQKI